jgi:hypothetical protein
MRCARTPLHTLVFGLGISLAACGPGEEPIGSTDALATCSNVAPAKELMITHLNVVNDSVRTRWTGSFTNASDGAWHFGRLMSQMAPAGADASDFVRTWLRQFATDRTINGQTVPARSAIDDILAAWPKRADGNLDLTKPPMRLLAIVNRMDLRNLARGRAGEGRFVFGVLDPSGNPLSFTVILEYNLPATTQAELLDWASDWHDLGTLTLGSAAYRTALQAVTDRFAARNAAPSRVNGSAISQVRTNEIALAFPWELREFRLNANGQLREVTVAQTPANALDQTRTLRDFVNQNEAKLLAGTHVVPLSFAGAPFRAASSFNNIDFWSATGIRSNDARHALSLNTCNGCHGAETSTGFLHISPRAANQTAARSGFLTGITVSDPVSGVSRTFNDLARRAADLRGLVCSTTAADSVAPEVGERVH